MMENEDGAEQNVGDGIVLFIIVVSMPCCKLLHILLSNLYYIIESLG